MEILDTPTKTKRTRRNRKEKEIVSREEQDLATHVEICAIRYQGIEQKFEQIDARMDKIEADIKEIKTETQQGFSDIKSLISAKMSSNHQALITAAGTVIVALIGFLGYLLTHLPK